MSLVCDSPIKIVYLADLDHFRPGNRISVPLNVACIKSYCDGLADIRLFKNPDKLIGSLRNPPDILGLSCFIWNTNLNKAIIKYVRKHYPETLIVTGGPSVGLFPESDIRVVGPGEKAFADIISGNRHSLIRGKAVKVSSPYLNGFLDEFLEEGLLPTFDTVRGCPYNCAYCGGSLSKHLIVKDEQEVYDELDYLQKKAKVRQIDLVDTNFGIMGKRDLRIAQYILKMYQETGFPFVTGWATSKNKSDISVEIMRTMAQITGKLYLGIQTLTESALTACNRKNLPISVFDKLIELSRKENIPIHVDLIFGLPTETRESFLKTLDRLARMGIEGPLVYQLRMLPGTELSEKRERYGYKTKFRVINNRWGDYCFGRIVELEEVAVSSNSFNLEDYLFIRRIGFLACLLLEYGTFAETVKLLVKNGVNFVSLLDYLSNCNIGLFKEYDEWVMREFSDEPCFKINLGFVGYCLFDGKDVLSEIEYHIRKFSKGIDITWAALEDYQRLISTEYFTPYKIPEEQKLKRTVKDCGGLDGYYCYERIITNAPRVSLRRRKNGKMVKNRKYER